MKTFLVRRIIYKFMKLLLLIPFFILNVYSQASFEGTLFDSDNNIISSCSLQTDLKIFNSKEITISEVKFLKEKISNVKLKFFTTNSVDGNLYITKNRNKAKFVLNTDSEFNLIEFSIFYLNKKYRCSGFYEK